MKRILLLALSLAVLSCGPKKAELLPAENFSGSVDGKPVSLYTLKGGKLIAQYTNFGGRGVTLFAPDRHGNMRNIVVGHATLDEYVRPVGERFLGACVGPVANRIGGAHFCIGEELFSTPANDNEVNTLHGGFIGLDNVVWDVEAVTDSSLTLHFLHPDGMEGYPGNLDITMTYSLTSKDELRVDYRATTDAPTPVNISHHPFFNLRGEGEGTVEDYACASMPTASFPSIRSASRWVISRRWKGLRSISAPRIPSANALGRTMCNFAMRAGMTTAGV